MHSSHIVKALGLCLMLALAPCTGKAQESDSLIRIPSYSIGSLFKTSTFTHAGVHDPSIVAYTTTTGRKYYYIFGTHLGVAYSTDLKNWTTKYTTSSCSGLFGTMDNAGKISSLTTYTDAFHTNMTKSVNKLSGSDTVSVDFGNFDASAWSTSSGASLDGDMWAPDVIYNKALGKWCMYLSLNGDNWRSVIIMLSSSNITGPYVYQGPVVYSGFQWTSIAEASWKLTDLELVLGTQSSLPSRYNMGSSWGNRWPNCIDPCVFYDEQGELWMSYGSWSGGIFIIKLDKNTGLRDYTTAYAGNNNNSNGVVSDPYFGKRIAGGYYVSGEGSYIKHIGNYYFLFVTYGGLDSKGGYEMHVFRSTSPDGPYTDTNNYSAVYTSYLMNYGPSAGTTRGEKLLGPYQWDNMAYAELSQGHNSALVDDNGHAYLIYHTRYNNGTEWFNDRVHQLFLSEDGWLLAAPYEYSGSIINSDSAAVHSYCTTADIAGNYQVIVHKYKMDYANKAYQAPVSITLHSDGTISGDFGGSWAVTPGTSYFSITLKSNLSSTKTSYKGVILPQKVSETNMQAVCFTAVASNGVNVWGSNADGKLAVDCNYQSYTVPLRSSQYVTADVDLTSTPKYGATITWKSSREDVITSDGKLTIPTSDSTITVGMTCTITKGNYYFDRTINVRVKGDGTAVNTLQSDPLTRKIYDLQGRRLKAVTRPGLYIINGKKQYIQ